MPDPLLEGPLEDRVRLAYEFFNARRLPELVEMMDPDVNWPDLMTGERLRGRDAVSAHLETMVAATNVIFDPCEITVLSERQAEVIVRHIVRDPAGTLLADHRMAHVFKFNQGRLRRFDVRPA